MIDFDRAAESLGNIVGLEHVNVCVPDQALATTFYVLGLGLTRDPELMTGTNNMWINIGRRSQFHLPTGNPEVLRGHVGLLLPDRDALLARLESVAPTLAGTQFAYAAKDGYVEATSPWGNRFRCFAPAPEFGESALGMIYVQFDVPPGSAPGIARFYDEILDALADVEKDEEGTFASVGVGPNQRLRFRETDQPIPAYDGHHVQVYLADFSGPHTRLAARGLVTEESSQWQYRFKDIVDLDSGDVLFTVEHEVRSMTHPMYGRPLYNAA